MPTNGKLTAAELSPIGGGLYLANDAAAAWNAPGGPRDAGCYTEGPQGAYRDFAEQEVLWAAYQNGTGNLAAYPGTSNHGLGVADDLAILWMRSWVDEHGAKYGWKKTEAFSEWWHVCFVGGVHFPTFHVLKKGSKGKRVAHYTRRLAYIRRGRRSYLGRWFYRYTTPVEEAVRTFQQGHGLSVDGKIGPATGSLIDATFLRQWHHHHKRRGKKPRRVGLLTRFLLS